MRHALKIVVLVTGLFVPFLVLAGANNEVGADTCNVTNSSVMDKQGRVFVASGKLEGVTKEVFINFIDNVMFSYEKQCPEKIFTLKIRTSIRAGLSGGNIEIQNGDLAPKEFSVWYKEKNKDQ